MCVPFELKVDNMSRWKGEEISKTGRHGCQWSHVRSSHSLVYTARNRRERGIQVECVVSNGTVSYLADTADTYIKWQMVCSNTSDMRAVHKVITAPCTQQTHSHVT